MCANSDVELQHEEALDRVMGAQKDQDAIQPHHGAPLLGDPFGDDNKTLVHPPLRMDTTNTALPGMIPSCVTKALLVLTCFGNSSGG